jgi:hypothetical protein
MSRSGNGRPRQSASIGTSTVIGVFVATLLVQALGVGPALAVVDRKSHQFNLANHKWQSWSGAGDPAIDVNFNVTYASERPMTVSTQEVCYDQFNTMHSSLSGIGYYTYFVPTKTSAAECGGLDFGIMVANQGSYLAIGGGQYGSQYPSDTSRGEYRKIACLETAVYLIRILGCTTHLTAADPTYARAQANEALAHVNSYTADDHKFFGGDFNLDPVESLYNLSDYYSYYWEADQGYDQKTAEQCRVQNSPYYEFPRTRKYDYIWGSRNNLSVAPPAGVYVTDESDHCYMIATFPF